MTGVRVAPETERSTWSIHRIYVNGVAEMDVIPIRTLPGLGFMIGVPVVPGQAMPDRLKL